MNPLTSQQLKSAIHLIPIIPPADFESALKRTRPALFITPSALQILYDTVQTLPKQLILNASRHALLINNEPNSELPDEQIRSAQAQDRPIQWQRAGISRVQLQSFQSVDFPGRKTRPVILTLKNRPSVAQNLIYLSSLRSSLPRFARHFVPVVNGREEGIIVTQVRTHFCTNFWLHLLLRGEFFGQLEGSLGSGKEVEKVIPYPNEEEEGAVTGFLEFLLKERVGRFLRQ